MTMFEEEEDQAIAEINATPLIDVLLVLLIMVIVTVPIEPQLIDLVLPADTARPTVPPPVISLDVDDSGVVRWNGELCPDASCLDARLDEVAQSADPAEIRLKAGSATAYGDVVAIMAAVQRHHLNKFGLLDTARFLDQASR